MNETRTKPQPRTATPSAAPARPTGPVRPLPVQPTAPDAPTWTHRLLPATLRRAMAGLGWWQNPAPQKPSDHLAQTLETLRRYGWCQSLDVSPTGRMCIRGAQNLLEKTGHVTPHARQRAVAYMEETLHHAGITMSFFTWNDLPGQDQQTVETLLVKAMYQARANGD